MWPDSGRLKRVYGSDDGIDKFEYLFDGGCIDDVDFVSEARVAIDKGAQVVILQVDDIGLKWSELCQLGLVKINNSLYSREVSAQDTVGTAVNRCSRKLQIQVSEKIIGSS